jgi:hypothetical protein
MHDQSLPKHYPGPFDEALDALLKALQTEPLRTVSPRQFFLRVEGWGYDALRKMLTGENRLQPDALVAMAEASDGLIEPEYWQEYRIFQIGEDFREFPNLEEAYYGKIRRDAEALRMEQQEANTNRTVHNPLSKKPRGRSRCRPEQ